ncbi:MAG TPA: NAD(P)H-dependent oxidoreductase subunit E, partial [Kofleriaceae bacterium]|nr:NAD(P)H-dependent oxidoreductase subunit E [Kofleriaceae bacterium]
MDLKLGGAVATAEERAAIAAVLGEPATGWDGGERGAPDLHVARTGHATRTGRSRLLLVLHAVNDRVGWISPGAIDHIAARLDVAPAEIYGVATFYGLFSLRERTGRQVHVCVDLACQMAGATVPPGAHESPCLGVCERAPAALVIAPGDPCRHAVIAPTTPSAIERAVAGEWPEPEAAVEAAVPQAGAPGLVLLGRVGAAPTLTSYLAGGGYRALRRAIELGPSGVIREVLDSGLVGRGGAAFPAGRKWDAVARQPARPHYLVCNADESEPGTFKDRVLLEGDPFAVIESMTIAAHATGCERGFIYLRGEYPRATEVLLRALDEARARGLLGADVSGAGFDFDIELFRGAGAYICGEETAIFNSIEGYRGEPRNKPPYPVESGLFGKPTVVNNVETLVNVIPILLGGGPAFASVGTRESTGTKLFCVSGSVRRPGVYEVTF